MSLSVITKKEGRHEVIFKFSLMTDQVKSAVLKRYRNTLNVMGNVVVGEKTILQLGYLQTKDERQGACTKFRLVPHVPVQFEM